MEIAQNTQKKISIDTPTKRKLQSPENNTAIDKKHKMTQEQSTLDAILMKLNKLDSIESTLKGMEAKIDSLTHDLQNHKEDTANKFQRMEVELVKLRGENVRLKDLENKMAQEMLVKDVMCFGVPSNYHNKVDELLDSLNRYFDTNLSRATFSNIHIAQSNKPQTTMRMKFVDQYSKRNFMLAVDAMSRDEHNKRQPIVVEDIFEELKSNQSTICGRTINFTNSLTKANQNILRMKREIKPHFFRERDGHLFLKKDTRSREVEVHSVDQVRALVTSYRNNSN